ncbi:hypothetical protein ABT115_09485 [Streptomyces sp. NPDC001832]|uniref:hypothetical protein n=1 Tax=Streptomyces sp. NPDC001832 TaxID=3154527 RepID=UPI00331E3A11
MKQYEWGAAAHGGVRPGAVSRTAPAGALSAALLVLATACSVAGGGGAGSVEYDLRSGVAASPAATGPVGLAAKALKRDSVPGLTVTTPTGKDAPKAKDVRAERACRPLARAAVGVAVGDPEDTVVRRVSDDGLVTTVTLASYKGEDAVDALAELSTAADSCGGGFTLTVVGEEREVTGAVREHAPEGSDQAMGFGLTLRTDGAESAAKVIIMRRGTTVCLFTTTGAGAASAPKDLVVPLTVVETQFVTLA